MRACLTHGDRAQLNIFHPFQRFYEHKNFKPIRPSVVSEMFRLALCSIQEEAKFFNHIGEKTFRKGIAHP